MAESKLKSDALRLSEKICNAWIIRQTKNRTTFERAEMEEIFKMAAALREKAGQE